jgi:hypothetical protein
MDFFIVIILDLKNDRHFTSCRSILRSSTVKKLRQFLVLNILPSYLKCNMFISMFKHNLRMCFVAVSSYINNILSYTCRKYLWNLQYKLAHVCTFVFMYTCPIYINNMIVIKCCHGWPAWTSCDFSDSPCFCRI